MAVMGDEDASRGKSICGRPSEQDGMTPGDLRGARHNKSMLIGNRKGTRKILDRDMPPGFRNEETPWRI